MTEMKSFRFDLYTVLRDSCIILFLGAVLLLVFEGALRVIAPQVGVTEYEDNSLAIADPVLGHILRPNAQGTTRTPEFHVKYIINKEGLRDRSFHSKKKDPSTTRILILGDSFAFGAGNQYQDIWPVIFENHLLKKGFKVEVVKAGVAAYDTRLEYLYLQRIFPRYKPDIVLLTFLPNDLFTNVSLEDTNAQIKREQMRTVISAQSQHGDLHSLILLKRVLMSFDIVYTKLYLLTARSKYYQRPPTEEYLEKLHTTRNIMSKMKEVCAKENALLAVLSIPQLFQVIVASNEYKLGKVDVGLIDRDLGVFAKGQEIIWIPTLSVLVEQRLLDNDPLYYRYDGHLNKQGNLVVGRYCAKAFEEQFGESMKRIAR